MSSKHGNLHLLTRDRNDTYLVQNASSINWYYNNSYQGGLSHGQFYKRGHWELFKSSRFLETCQFQVVDVQRNWRHLFHYFDEFILRPSGNSAPIPNYLLLILSENGWLTDYLTLVRYSQPKDIATKTKSSVLKRIHRKIHSPLPIYCFTNVSIYFTPFLLRINIAYNDLDSDYKFYNEVFILPFWESEMSPKWTMIEAQRYWKIKFLTGNGQFWGTRNGKDNCVTIFSSKTNMALKLLLTGHRLVQKCVEAHFSSSNTTRLVLSRLQLDAATHSKDFFEFIKKHPYIFRFGISCHGYRYLILVDSKQIESKAIINLKALLLPFSFQMWAFSTSAVISIVVFAYAAGHSSPCFHTFAIFLEQGDVTLKTRMSVTISFSMLLVLGFILRLAYTSSMYSYLTVQPEPSVPQSFEESVLADDYFKFAEPISVQGVFDRMNYEFDNQSQRYVPVNSTNRVLKSLLQKIYSLEIYPVNSMVAPAHFTEVSQLASLVKHNNTLLVEKFCVWENINEDKVQYFKSIQCGDEFVVAHKFVYIYSFPFIGKDESYGVDIFNAILFGNKRVFANNKPSTFPIMNGWFDKHDLSALLADDMVGKLEQAGILGMWKKFQKLFLVLKSWKKIKKLIGFQGKLNFNFVQVAHALSEDLSRAEYFEQALSDEQVESVTNKTLIAVWILFVFSVALSLMEFIWERVST
ncbi:unnamed protein product [Orchesella dallaii]|uniref:Uncharacterized protein n=1 Tax=Orchesella dallaii TaxID=48710 RepID=A0ABP1Q2Z8_9HEXA